MANSTLLAIQTKVRRLTRSPSEAQLTTDQINEYIDTFMLYDFPEHLRLFDMRTTFNFVTSPYIDVYPTNTVDPTDQFFNFKNKYITVHPPVYAAGFQMWYTQSRNEFFGNYPFLNSIQMIAAGDGVTASFTGTLNANPLNLTPPPPPMNQFIPVLQNNVLFDSLDINNQGLSLVDIPVEDGNGNPTNDGNLYDPNNKPTTPPTVIDPTNTINYVTGVYTITFTAPPAVGKPINSQSVPYQPTLPQAMLFYDNKFTLRPVPDQPYSINMEVYIRPTVLLAGQSPDIEQWWQYIAYGAAKKVFEDRMDNDSVAAIMPEFKQQELLVIRKTIVQQTNERVATIYTPMTDNYGGWGSGSSGWGGPF